MLTNGEAYQALKDAGASIPEGLEPPDILNGYGGWYEDFFGLSTERQIGMGVGPIPQSAIDRHTSGWRYDDADAFNACIRAMDRVYLEHSSNRDGASDDEHVSARDAFRGAFGDKKGRK